MFVSLAKKLAKEITLLINVINYIINWCLFCIVVIWLKVLRISIPMRKHGDEGRGVPKSLAISSLL